MALILLTVVSPVLAQGDGILEGQVLNGTSGGPDVGSGVVVTLRALRGGAPVEVYESTTDAGGRFRFEGLDTDPTLEYVPEATYLDVTYRSDEPRQFDEDQTSLDVTISVFETTDDDSAIGLDSVHLIAESFGQVLRISEIHLFGNSGDRTYIGRAGDAEPGRVSTVRIPLPDNGVGLALEQAESENRFIEVAGGVLDTDPIPPGSETSLVFLSYHLEVLGDTVPLERRFAYPLAGLNALVAQPDLSMRSEQMTAMGPQTFQDRQYEFYVGNALDADAPLSVEFLPAGVETGEGMPVAAGTGEAAAVPSTRGNQELLRWLGFGLVAVAVFGVLIYALATVRAPEAPDDVPAVPQTPASRKLLAELADLEDALEAGQLDQAEYERRRAELREALKSMPQ